jgi:carbon monoxide dehydrogenase subunit G
VSLVILLALAAPVPGLTEADVAAALRGEVPARTESFTLPGGKAAGRGVGAVLVERPFSQVWSTLSRFDDKAEYMPRLKAVSVLERRPDLLRVRMVVDASITTARYTAWFRLDEKARTISWRLDRAAPDNSIADTEGGYRLIEIDRARTLVVYRSYVDTGRMLPRFIQDYLTRRSIPNLLRAIKARIETDGLYRKR